MKQRVMLFQTARQGLSRVLETAECGKLGLGVRGPGVAQGNRCRGASGSGDGEEGDCGVRVPSKVKA